MTIQTLPDDPNYAFCPSYDLGDEPQQIRIVFEGLEGYVPTALVALTVDDAEPCVTDSTPSSDSPGMPGPRWPRRPCASSFPTRRRSRPLTGVGTATQPARH